jgi:iron complex outermembrane receptor protein
MSISFRRFLLSFSLILSIAVDARGDSPASVRFDIPAQALGTALLRFSEQARVQIVVANDLTKDLSAPTVKGELSATAALALLLQGSGLRYEVTGERTIAINGGGGDSSQPGAPVGAAGAGRSLGMRLATAGDAATAPAGQSANARGNSSDARGADDGAAGDGLAEVIVTAEKQGRSLKDTATSVSVLDAETLEKRPGINAVSDIMARMPNTATFGKSGIAPTVRGVDGTGPAIGANAFLAGTRNRLNIQMDGRPISYNEAIYGDAQLWDVQQVEVLRGPQSTLQGRNSIGGAVVINTEDPTREFEAGGRVIGGQQSLRHGSAYISGPLGGDRLAVRLAADYRTYDSFVDMQPSAVGVEHPEEYRAQTVRAKLLYTPAAAENVSVLFTLQDSKFRGPQVEQLRRPFSDHVSALADREPVFEPEATSGILNVSWGLGDSVTLENVLSYTDFTIRRLHQVDALIEGDELVWEPRARFSSAGGRFRGVAGGYYFKADQEEYLNIAGGAGFVDGTTTRAVFAEGTYAATDRVDLTLGARYEREHRDRDDTLGIFAIDLDETYSVFLPKLGLAWKATDATTAGLIVSKGYNGGGAGFTFEFPFVNFTFDPEYVWNYELYSRTEVGRGFVLTPNVFYSDYEGMQIPFDLNPDPALNAQIILNAEQVRTYGAELGGRWQAARGLELYGELGILRTRIDSPGSRIDDSELTRSPKFSGGVGAVYKNPTGFEFGLDARYSTGYFSDELNDPRGRVDDYWVANAQMAYNFERVRVFGSVTNLFDAGDTLAILYGNTFAQDVGFIQQPRRFMAGVQFNF